MPWRIFGKKKAPASSAEAFMEPILTGQDYFFALQLQPHPQLEAFSSFLTMQSLPPQSAHFLGLHRPSLVAPHFSHLNIAMVSPPVSCQTVIVCKPRWSSCRMFCVKPRPTSVGALPALALRFSEIIFSPGCNRCIILFLSPWQLCGHS